MLISIYHSLVGNGVFLIGNSEGAMTVARFPDFNYPNIPIRGRIICAWSLERNYFSRCGHPRLGGSAIATLNIIGDEDQFFGADEDSVAATVQRVQAEVMADTASASTDFDSVSGAEGEVLPAPEGHGLAALLEAGVEHGAVVLLEGARHDTTQTHDHALRAIIKEFLRKPMEIDTVDERYAAHVLNIHCHDSTVLRL